MRDQILRFLKAIDKALAERAGEGERLDLYLIGKAALILFYGVGRASAVTRDVDVVQISWPRAPLLELALQLFGKETAAVTTYGLYLEAVPSGLPPMPGAFRDRCRPYEVNTWQVLTVHQLDAHDLTATKLKRFAPKDREDVRELCDKGLLRPEELTAALESAFLWTTDKDGDEERNGAFEHLRHVIAYLEGEERSL